MATFDGCPDRAQDTEELIREVQLLQPYLMVVARACINRCRMEGVDAADLVQETIARSIQGIRSGMFAGDLIGLRAWTKRILVNYYQSLARRPKAPLIEPDPSTSATGRAIRREEARRLARALLTLGERARQIIAWRQDGLTFDEIGVRIGCTAAGARKAYLKAASELRSAFERCRPTAPADGRMAP